MKHTIRDLLHPVGPSVSQTQSLDAVLRTLDRSSSEYVIVRDLSHRPLGVITAEDIQRLRHLHPSDWSRRCCAQQVQRMPNLLEVDDPVDAAVEYYREYGIRLLVISHDGEPIGVLPPTEVFQWCAQSDGAVLEELASRARSAHPDRSVLISP